MTPTSHPRPNWSRRFKNPVFVKDGPKLRTLAQVRAYALTLPQAERAGDPWLRVLRLLFAAAEGGDLGRLQDAIVVATATHRAEGNRDAERLLKRL